MTSTKMQRMQKMVGRPESQIPGVYRRRIGDIVVTALSDGYLDASYDVFRGITPADAETILKEAFVPAPPRLSVNCFAIHSAGRIGLIDTGSGASMGPTLGRLPQHLADADIRIDAIDTVMLTHMHPDHSNGLSSPEGAACFPNAKLVVSERDVSHWHDDGKMAAATERQRVRYFEASRVQIEPYLDRRQDANGEVFPGVTAVPLFGHTPGHTGYLIASGGDSLLVWGDIVHFPDVQALRPEVSVEPDSDPDAAVATRRRVFHMVATDRMLVAGMHTHFPGLLHLKPRPEGGYVPLPEIWFQAL